MKDINDCSVIKKLNIDFVKQFKYAFIFNREESAIITTNDDCVYVCGHNTNGCFSLGHNDKVEVPTKLEELCHKRVIRIIDGSLMYALTSDGKVYVWGNNEFGFLGFENGLIKPTIVESFADKNVIDLKCGFEYWLALTMNGEVYQWGKRWEEDDDPIIYPELMVTLKLHTIIEISCGYDHSLVLNDNGVVFSRGDNTFGQLGCGNDDEWAKYKWMDVEGLGENKVIKISCGNRYSFVLTESGDVYGFGSNKCGQLGYKDHNIETKIATKIVVINPDFKVVDISSLRYYSESFIVSLNDGFCYVWGRFRNDEVMPQTITELKCLKSAEQTYFKRELTYNALYFMKKFDNMPVYERLVERFDNQQYSDLKFKIDGKYIYVRKSYLKFICKHFNDKFTDNVWLENKAKEVEITQYSYPVYYAFLKYLYTDSVNIQSKYLIDLYDLANSYSEGNLKRKCIEIMKNTLNANNVCIFYSFAVKNKLNELEKCFDDYIQTYDNISDVIKTEAFDQTKDNIILKKIVKTLAKKRRDSE